MPQYDYWSLFPRMAKEVTLGDITIRDGFQHEEKVISTRAKIFYLEEMIFAGCRHAEITNLGNSYLMPQFQDAEELLSYFNSSRFIKKCSEKGIDRKDICLTAVTIRQKAVERACELKRQGKGPDRILMMVSTDEQHHFANSGTSLKEYWEEVARSIQMAHDVGMTVCGTVSTIWGSPICGHTELEVAYDFTKRWLELGATTIEHADHDGSANSADVYRYFSHLLDRFPDPRLHVAHFHETKRIGSAAVLAALQAGITHFEATLGGIGGAPASFVDDYPCGLTQNYYHDSRYVGLICLEDTLLQIDEMGIKHGYNVERVLALGRLLEKTLGRRLRSEAIVNGPTQKNGHPEFMSKGLLEHKKRRGEIEFKEFSLK